MSALKKPIEEIVQYIRDQWDDTNYHLPIVLPNDDAEDLELTDGFLYLSPNITSSNFVSLNNPTLRVRTMGVIECNIHTPINQGIGPGLEIADTVADFIRGRDINGVVMYSPEIAKGESVRYTSQGRYWMTPLMCSFHFDSYKTTTG